MNTSPLTSTARSFGQSQNGGSEALAGMPMRIAATFCNERRCTTALMKWVVPITTASTGTAAAGLARSAFSASRMPEVTSAVVGRLTEWTTFSSAIRTASVLVPPTSIPMRFIRSDSCLGGREEGTEIEVVAEGAGADEFEAAGARKDVRRRQRDDCNALAVTHGLGADAVTVDAVEHADQVGRHRDWCLAAPGDDPFVLEGEFQPVAAVGIAAFDQCRAAQESFGGAARDIDDLAGEQLLAAFARKQRGDRVFMATVGCLDGVADANGLGRREMDAPVLDLAPGARRLAGGGDRAHLDADLSARALHPFPARHLGDDGFDAARIVERAGIGT